MIGSRDHTPQSGRFWMALKSWAKVMPAKRAAAIMKACIVSRRRWSC